MPKYTVTVAVAAEARYEVEAEDEEAAATEAIRTFEEEDAAATAARIDYMGGDIVDGEYVTTVEPAAS